MRFGKEAVKMKHMLCLILPLLLLLPGFSAFAKMPEEEAGKGQTESVAEADSIREAGSAATVSGAGNASGGDAESVLTKEETRKIYLDASLTGPPNAAEIWYWAHRSGDEEDQSRDLTGRMQKEIPVTKGEHTWTCVFVAELPTQYDEIRFSLQELKNGGNEPPKGSVTEVQKIPENLSSPCFYLDADDPSLYEATDRGGYWDEAFEVRDPETEYAENLEHDSEKKISEGGLTEIPEMPDETEQDALYLNCDLYDYYTDYELNGIPRSDFSDSEKSDRTWVPFRNLNEALSDAYRQSGGIPLYVGHFQPDAFEKLRFSELAPILNLTGWDDENGFFSTNNSTLDAAGGGSAEDRKYACAAQGLIGKELVNGYPVCRKPEGPEDTDARFPLFSKSFLEGKNSRNVKLGRVYRNAAFPFHQVDRDQDGILYWSFDSAETHLHLTKPVNADQNGFSWYFKDCPVSGKGRRRKYIWSKNMTSAGEPDPASVSDEYGFFPLNSLETDGNGYAYNYGFGLRMAFDFRLPKDGVLKNKNGQNRPVAFSFSGDDDLWVFVDGKLVLDVGGDHGKVEGTVNFADDTAFVSRVKKSQGDPDAEEGPCTTKFQLADTGEKHQLVLFYLERGMWESNLKLQFNMAPERAEEPKEMELPNTGEGGISAIWLAIGMGLFLVSFLWIGRMKTAGAENRRIRFPIGMMLFLAVTPVLFLSSIQVQASSQRQVTSFTECAEEQGDCDSWMDPLTATAELRITDFPAKTDFYAAGISDSTLKKFGIYGEDVPVGKLADAAVKLSDSMTERQKEMIHADGMTIRGLAFDRTYLITGHAVENDAGKVTPLPFLVRPTKEQRVIHAEVKYTLESTAEKHTTPDQKRNKPGPDAETSVELKKKDGKVTLEPVRTGDVDLKEVGITILSALILGMAVIIRKKIK